jgi:hypothetical protein
LPYRNIKNGKFVECQWRIKTNRLLTVLENEFKSARAMGEKFYWNARRLDPITKADAFRDESVSTIFDEQKINDQLDHNETYDVRTLTRGNFSWQDNIPDSKVIWTPTAKVDSL